MDIKEKEKFEQIKKENLKKNTGKISSKSLLVRFNFFFFVFSIIPLGVLGYFFYQYLNNRSIDLTDTQVIFLISLVGTGCIVGFFGVRNSLIKLVLLSNKLRETLLGKMDTRTILELAKEEGEVAELAKVFGEVMGRLEKNVEKLRETKATLHKILSRAGKTIASVENFELLIKLTLENAVEALLASRGVIYSFREDKAELELKACVGIDQRNVPRKVALGEGSLGWVAKEKKPLFVPYLEERKVDQGLFSPPLICSPLISRDKLLGVILVSGRKTDDNFSEDELRLLSNLATQIAVSLENAKLNTDIEKTYFETMSALALTVEAKDPYSRGHSERVADFSVRIAEQLDLDKKERDNLRDAGRLHDLGKIGILDNVLKKKGGLSEDETIIMEKHPLVGESIIKPLKSFQSLADPIRHHHEKLDGSGYPDGLTADNISLVTRILTVADIFDALTSDRPYRKALSYDEAIKVLEEDVQKGRLDDKVVKALKEVL